jgi:hypothetical protein
MTACHLCGDPLLIRLDDGADSDGDREHHENEQVEYDTAGHETIPDDLELPCGCHFHW